MDLPIRYLRREEPKSKSSLFRTLPGHASLIKIIGVPYRTPFCLKIQRISNVVGHFLFRCFSHVFERSAPPSGCHPVREIAKTCRQPTPL
jgi:hypothetical protein